MKFQRRGPLGSEQPVVETDEGVFDLRPVAPDIDGAFLAADGIQATRDALRDGRLPRVDDLPERVGAPLARPGKIVCIGLNYRDHAAETGAAIPDEPIIFMKDPSTVVGPHDDVLLPPTSVKTDWEVELGVVIGRTARYLPSTAAARDVIAGYVVSHDVSEREYQLERGGQWDKGKSCESFNPLGPDLVPADEVDPAALGLRLWVNGTQRQDGTTADLIFDVDHVVWYLSQFMVLRPGDLINTGTPAGVALGLPDHPYLGDGDVVELEIDGLGRQRSTCVRAEVAA
jgi:2-keto-4-pentenoate hydratase/2-oxohepta-3-ene-1,7-dioic acid hydratase in catechol pathway